MDMCAAKCATKFETISLLCHELQSTVLNLGAVTCSNNLALQQLALRRGPECALSLRNQQATSVVISLGRHEQPEQNSLPTRVYFGSWHHV